MRPRPAWTGLALIFTLASGCGSDGPAGPEPESVWFLGVGPSPRVVLPPTTPLRLDVSVYDSLGHLLPPPSRTAYEWSSSDSAVATVSRDGVVRVVTTATQGSQSLIRVRYGRGEGFVTIHAALPPIGARVAPARTITPGARLLLRGLAVNPQGLEEEGHLAEFRLLSGGAGARLTKVGCPEVPQCVFNAPDLAWLSVDAPGEVTVQAAIDGQVGTATIPVRTVSFTSVSAGGHTCGAGTDGALFCWGIQYLATPVQVRLPGITEVQAGPTRTCGLDADRLAYCWQPHPDPVPEPISTTIRFSRLAIGLDTSCGLDLDGKGWCWGANGWGQLGDGTRNPSLVPVPVVGGHTFAEIAIYDTHACALTPAGEAYCWGSNGSGELGGPPVTDDCPDFRCSTVPVPAAAGLRFDQIVTGESFTCGRAAEGPVWCWGGSLNLGAGNPPAPPGAPGPVQAGGGQPFTALTAGRKHACGLTPLGLALCWGFNAEGQTGQAPSDVIHLPTAVRGARSFLAIEAGTVHTCALDEDGLYCWGDNGAAQLGHSGVSGAAPALVAGQP